MEKEVHQFHMAGVAHGFIVDIVDFTQIGFAHGAQPARGGERFELHAINIKRFEPLHGGDPFALTLFNHFTIIEIFIDHPLGRPIERITQQACGVLW